MDNKLALRDLFPQLQAHLAEKEITVLVGPRQVGKTTLINLLKENLVQSGQASVNQVFYFNLDIVTDSILFEDQSAFIQFLKNRLPSVGRLYIFVDEAQRLTNAGLFFKGVYDLNLPVKLILTGSSSLEIRTKMVEPLTGRKRLFILFPLTFKEYLEFKSPDLVPFLNKDDAFSRHQILEYLNDFLLFGGYPKVAQEKDYHKRIGHLEEIYSSYVERDITGFFKIKDPHAFTQLVKILAQESGNLFSVQKTSRDLQIKNTTLKNYLLALENTFIAQRVFPYSKVSRLEIRKMPKTYFLDTGIRNFACFGRNFPQENLLTESDRGRILETFVFTELLKQYHGEIKFWRTKDGAEVDFIINCQGKTVALEVKVGGVKETSSGLKAFSARYTPFKSAVISLKGPLFPFQLPHFLNTLKIN